MRKLHLAGLLLGSAIILAGCNIQASGGGGAPANTAAPASTAAPAPPPAAPAPAGEEGSAAPTALVQGQARQNFTVVNNTGHVVMTLNVSPSSETVWGPDILGRDVLGNGESTVITFDRDESVCMWDIRATYDDGDTTDMRQVNLCQVATVTLTP
jgi:hypothetical protein